MESKNNEVIELCEWNDRVELILKGWGEKASCFQLMHDRTYKRYWYLNTWFAIPIIILSTLTGTANFAQESFGEAYKYYIIYTVASVNILVGLLQTIAQYLKLGQMVEGHRLASISWDKFSRKLKVELSKDRNSRQNACQFLLNSQETFDRLIEITPVLPQDTIQWMNKMIDTGSNIDENRCCFYKVCCFPCGCRSCLFICDKDKYYKKKKLVKSKIGNIQFPEILGNLEPIQVNSDNISNNQYSIYNHTNV